MHSTPKQRSPIEQTIGVLEPGKALQITTTQRCKELAEIANEFLGN
jgi:hypothetical protein